MSLTLADKDPLEVTVDDLREVIDLWADRKARTRAKVTSVRAFWSWAEEQDQVPSHRQPSCGAHAPRRAAPLLPQNADSAPKRRSDAARSGGSAVPARHGRPARRARRAPCMRHRPEPTSVTVFGKGRKSRVIPLRGRIVLKVEAYMLEPLPRVGGQPEPDDFILYPEKRTDGGRLLAAYPKRRMSQPTIHRWTPARTGGGLGRRRHDERSEHAPGAPQLRHGPAAGR
jgi:hypothetical protein